MIWGTGTGRCGTKSLAKDLGGLHEPQPWFGDLAKKYYYGNTLSPEDEQELYAIIHDRIALNTPTVDVNYSYILPLIDKLDPYAFFVFVFRHPIDCISSFMAGGLSTALAAVHPKLVEDHQKELKRYQQVDVCTSHYKKINSIICGEAPKLSHKCLYTSELKAHENKHPKSGPEFKLTRAEAKYIMDETSSYWTMIRRTVLESK